MSNKRAILRTSYKYRPILKCAAKCSEFLALPLRLTAQLSTWVTEGKKRMIHIIWKRSGEWEEGRNNAMWVLDITFRITASFTPFLGRPENDSAFKCFSHLPKVNLIVMLTDQTTRQGDQDTTKVGKRISRALSKVSATYSRPSFTAYKRLRSVSVGS